MNYSKMVWLNFAKKKIGFSRFLKLYFVEDSYIILKHRVKFVKIDTLHATGTIHTDFLEAMPFKNQYISIGMYK